MSEPYVLGDKEFESVLRLDGPGRYEHFLKRICDTERIFLLAEEDHPVLLIDDEGEQQLALWPHLRYARAYGDTRGAAGYAEIDLAELVELMLPDLIEHGVSVGVMPSPDGTTALVSSEKLKADILAYHDEWYGGYPK